MPALHLLLHTQLLEEQGDVTIRVGGSAAHSFFTSPPPPSAPHSSHSIQSDQGFTTSVKKSDGHLERQEAL